MAKERTARGPLGLVRAIAQAFLADRCPLLAAALCYTTALSLVPFLAVAFSLAKALGLYEAPFLREALLRLSAEKAEVADAVLGYIGNTNLQALGAIGVATLFLTSVGLLGAMESALNAIWNARDHRTGWSRFSNFITVIVVCPVFILAAFSATASLHNAAVVEWMARFSLANQAYLLVVKALPVIMVWAALFLLYYFLPSAPVRRIPALVGALLAALGWQAAQAAYIRYQVAATGYNAVYGGFAQVPLLLVWLYISWLVVLAGAEAAKCLQQGPGKTPESSVTALGMADRRDLMLVAALMLTERAEDRGGPLTAQEAAAALGLDVTDTARALAELVRMGAAALVADAQAPGGYVLVGAPDKLHAGDLLAEWENLAEPGDKVEPGLGFAPLAALRGDIAAALRVCAPQTLRELWQSLPEKPNPNAAGRADRAQGADDPQQPHEQAGEKRRP